MKTVKQNCETKMKKKEEEKKERKKKRERERERKKEVQTFAQEEKRKWEKVIRVPSKSFIRNPEI